MTAGHRSGPSHAFYEAEDFPGVANRGGNQGGDTALHPGLSSGATLSPRGVNRGVTIAITNSSSDTTTSAPRMCGQQALSQIAIISMEGGSGEGVAVLPTSKASVLTAAKGPCPRFLLSYPLLFLLLLPFGGEVSFHSDRAHPY